MFAIDALKSGFSVAKKSIFLMVIIGLFNFITSAIMLGVIGLEPTPEKIAEVLGVMIALFFITIILWVFIEGGFFSSIVSQLKENTQDMKLFASKSMKFFFRLLGINLMGGMIAVLMWLIAAILAGLFVAMGKGVNPFFNAIGFILFITAVIISLIISIPIFMAHFILVIEDGKLFASLKKSFSLFKRYWGRIAGLFLLVGLVFVSFSAVANLIGFILGKILPAGWPLGILNIFIISVVNGIASVFTSSSIVSLVLSLLIIKPIEETKEVTQQ